MSNIKLIRVDGKTVTHAFTTSKVPTGAPTGGEYISEATLMDSMSGPDLVALFNRFHPTGVVRFASREVGVRRCWALLLERAQSLPAEPVRVGPPVTVPPAPVKVTRGPEVRVNPSVKVPISRTETVQKMVKPRRKRGEPKPPKGPRRFNYTPWPVNDQRVPKPGSASEALLKMALSGITVTAAAEALGKSRHITENMLVLLNGNFGYGLRDELRKEGDVWVRAFREVRP